jgi:predicted transcriptional regulator
MSATVTTSIKLDAETKARVQRLAESRQRSSHWLLREAVEQYVEREEERERLRTETLQRWHEFETTGLHLTGEEADAWLAKLEAGEDVDPPECHT